jgi:hypothetical protein
MQQLFSDNAEYPHRIILSLYGPSAIFVLVDNRQCKIPMELFKAIFFLFNFSIDCEESVKSL